MIQLCRRAAKRERKVFAGILGVPRNFSVRKTEQYRHICQIAVVLRDRVDADLVGVQG